MKRTGLYYAYAALDDVERRELAKALKQHGGSFDFLEYDAFPTVIGSWKHAETFENYIVTRAKANGENSVTLWGHPANYEGDEIQVIEYLAHGQYGYVIDQLPSPLTVYVVFDDNIFYALEENNLNALKRYYMTEWGIQFKKKSFDTKEEAQAFLEGVWSTCDVDERSPQPYHIYRTDQPQDQEIIKILEGDFNQNEINWDDDE